MLNRPLNAVLTRIAIVFAVLATLVLILPTASAQDMMDEPCTETDGAVSCDYDENDDADVATFTAADPERQDIDWELDGVDKGAFNIDGGVLTFKESPNYEDPGDMARVDDPDTTDVDEEVTGEDNAYQVTVVAIEMLAEGQTPPAKRKSLDVTVNVMNVEEPGSISFNRLQTRVGVSDGVTATLTDPDTRNADGNDFTITPTWAWSIPKVNRPVLDKDDHWTFAGGGDATTSYDASHSATSGDANKVLRAKASYTDAQGAMKTAYATTAHTVAPALAVDATNNDPEFDEMTVPFMVAEDAAVGTVVGTVRATDADTADILSHELTGTDAPSFDIDIATGEITLAAMLDHERAIGGNEEYSITVTAYDPSNEASETPATVTITATDVNEKPNMPTVTNGEMSFSEGQAVVDDPDTTGTDEAEDAELGTFTAIDQDDTDTVDDDSVTLELDGDDAAAFKLTDDGAGSGTADDGSYELRFASSPDYESPTDANMDSVYKVSIVAKDDDGLTNMTEELSITVTNIEEPGMLKLSSDQPGIDVGLEATLTDPDNGIANAKWQWYAMDTKPTLPLTDGDDDGDFIIDELPASAMIEGATSMSYTPRPKIDADEDAGIEAYAGDEGKFLVATVLYSDNAPPMDDANTMDVDESLVRELVEVSVFAVRKFPDVNHRPAFASAAMSRDVNENETDVPEAVTADDPDGDPLAYDITGGADMAAFDIDDNGQISTMGDTKLDAEGDQTTYVVVVMAMDPFGQTDSTTVTINVINVNEEPEFEADDPDDYEENGMGAVATFMATDPEDAAIEWTISGLDSEDFEIDMSTGVLTFADSPNYEMPSDRNRDAVTAVPDADPPVVGVVAESPMDNDYLLTVTATEVRAEGVTDAAMATSVDITVKVTNVEEPGTITLNRLETRIDEDGLTATLADPDGPTSGETAIAVDWEWSVPKVSRPVLDDDDHWTDTAGTQPTGTTQTEGFTTTTTDLGGTLRVKASYTDGEGAMKEAYATVANTVAAARSDVDNEDPAFGAQVTTSFTVAEDTMVGTVVGTVRGSDDDTADILSHELTVEGGNTTDSTGKFEIDIETGVIKIASALNHEDSTLTDGAYTVTVTVYDANNESGNETVTITATDVNEAPDAPTGTEEVMSINESHAVADDPDTGVNEAEAAELGSYTATDQDDTDTVDDDTVTLELGGEDAAAFKLTDDGTGGGTADNGTYELRFESSPDYESPTSASGSNAYKVSIVAKDNEGLTSMKALTIMVMNVDEPGTVTLSTRQPALRRPVTAELTDEDGGVTGAKWQWYATDTPPVDRVNDDDEILTAADIAANAMIEGATTMTYTPKATIPAVEDDPATPEDETAAVVPGDEGMFLTATVSYRDAASTAEDVDSTPDVDESLNQHRAETSENAVRDDPLTNSRPDFGGPQMREVREDTTAGSNVGAAVEAMDADGDTLRYKKIGGADMGSFDVNRDSGQITVGAGTMLDFEGDQTTYMIEIEATDPFDGRDTTMVTITVTDFNEPPDLSLVTAPTPPMPPAENVAPMFAAETAEFMVYENMDAGTAVGTVEATDEGDTLTYSDDSGYFDVDNSGNITTAMMLDHEAMSSHTVTVTATDDEDASDSITVTVAVGDAHPDCTVADNNGLTNDCEALLDSMGEGALGGSLDWTAGTDVAGWEGVTVSGEAGSERVTRLWLRAKGLDGTIPAALGRLEMLTVLNLHTNMLSGDIPDLGGLTMLEGLYLSNNQLTGSVPAWLNEMAAMTDLWLWNNQLSGNLPDLSGMTSLDIAKLQNNMLTGGVPDGTKLPPNARWILLQSNNLGGEIPDLTALSVRTLWLHTNDLTGMIDPENLPASVTSLELRDNSLSGGIPDLTRLSNLTYLRLQGNDLTGTIPGTLGDLAKLSRLNLSGNQLTGIDAGLENAAGTLTNLYLAGNNFDTGTCLPVGLMDVTNNDFDDAMLAACPVDDGS